MSGIRVGLVGATGVVGETILHVLDERRVPVGTLIGYASRAREDAFRWRGEHHPVAVATAERLAADDLDVVIFASSDDASAELARACAERGTVVIDNSATFRLDPACPLVIPEVNPDAIGPEHRIFPVGNCTAIVLCVALKPILDRAGLRAVRVATYQAVSGAGRAGLDALAAEERGDKHAETPFAAPIYRNVIPQVGSWHGEGDTGEEQKVIAETRKTLGLPELHVAATTVRVPVRRAHSEAVFFETESLVTRDDLVHAFMHAPGLVYHDRGIVTPQDVEDSDLVHVARLRSEGDSRLHWQMWIVGDQLRKGAATNGVQILELLLARGLVRRASAA